MVMVLRVVWSPYGREAALALRAAVADAKAGEPLSPVTVVVPSNHVGVASRRLLSSGTLGPVTGAGVGLAAVTFLTTYRLAELLAASALAGQGKRPVSTPVLAAAMRAELSADAGLFGPVREHPATESALVATYRELRDLSPMALDALAAASDRAREVVRLHRATRARLAAEWSDEEDLLEAAAALAGSAAVRELGQLVVHLPQRLSRHSALMLRALAEHVPTTVVAGLTGIPEADAEVMTSVGRLGADLSEAAGVGDPAPVSPARTTVVTASDGDEEVRAAVRAVVDAVRAGVRLDRIAVLHASPEPYARLAHEQLHAAGIATNGAAVLPLSARMAGRTLLELLGLPVGGYRRQDVFAWLASAPVIDGARLVPTTSWERISREAAVVAGREDWNHRLALHALRAEERAAELEGDDDEPEWRAQRKRREAERARDLQTFVLGVIDDLGRATARPRRWSEHAEWASRWLTRLLGATGRRERWSLDERKAADRVEEALHRLGALDAVEGEVSLEVFSRTLEVELESDLGRVGRFGEGVLVGSVDMAIGLDLDLVVVLGLAEGSFPSSVRDDSLLPDHERARTGPELTQRAERVERQHRHLLAALAGADQQLLGVPRGDLRRSVERVPSRWVLDLCAVIAGSPTRWWTPDLFGASEPWVQQVASFDAGLRHLAVPATAQEHRLRTLLSRNGSIDDATDPLTAQGARVVRARRSAEFTRFDGNLIGLPVPSPVQSITSPTRLERWAVCPHRHLIEDLLRAAPVENPEDNLMITPMDKGSLIHDALEAFLLRVLERPESARPAPGAAWSAADHDLLQQIGSAQCDRYEANGLTGRRVFWTRDRRRILADLHRTLEHDSTHRRAVSTTPLAAELGFGWVGERLPAVELTLPDGRVLRVRGRIDRVDRTAEGAIHVLDYKTGSARDFEKLSEADPVAGGTKLQLPIYGLAGRLAAADPGAAVRADYWFVTSRGDFKRVGYDITPEVLQTTVEVLDVIVRGVEGGVFPPRPKELSTFFYIDCHTCDPDGLGTAELRKQWERKRSDPALAAYADLAEPIEVEEAEAAS